MHLNSIIIIIQVHLYEIIDIRDYVNAMGTHLAVS